MSGHVIISSCNFLNCIVCIALGVAKLESTITIGSAEVARVVSSERSCLYVPVLLYLAQRHDGMSGVHTL